MEQIQFDKIKLELSRMDDEYWEQVTDRGTQLSEQSAKLTAEIKDVFTKLAVTQVNILEAKRSGYKRLIENKKKSAVAGIVSENKERIDELVQEKNQAITELSNLITQLTTVIKEVQTLGKISPTNGGESNG